MHTLKDYSIFDSSSDGQDGGAEADMNNLDTTIQVSSNPTIRIHKDHHLDQVIGDLQSATQTRNMTKNLEEYGYPLDEAVIVAMSTIKEHYIDINEVHFLLFADGIYNVWVEKAKELLPNLNGTETNSLTGHQNDNNQERSPLAAGRIGINMSIRLNQYRNETNKKHEEWGGDQGYNENGTVQPAYVADIWTEALNKPFGSVPHALYKPVAADPVGDARSKVQKEIGKEFVAMMASGTIRACEAAAVTTKKVMPKFGHMNAAKS
ncbi:ribonuclease H-like domain-containing protein [Tanacetum coccineum]